MVPEFFPSVFDQMGANTVAKRTFFNDRWKRRIVLYLNRTNVLSKKYNVFKAENKKKPYGRKNNYGKMFEICYRLMDEKIFLDIIIT